MGETKSMKVGRARRVGHIGEAGLLVLLSLGLSTCGGNEESLTAENVGEKFAEAFCAAKARCCGAQGAPLDDAALDVCKLEERRVPLLQTAAALDRVFSPDGAKQCVKAASRYDCTNQIMIEENCQLVFTGQLPLGSPCNGATQCGQPSNGHTVCSQPYGSGGICVLGNWFQRAGSPCLHAVVECDFSEGLWCNGGTCTGPRPIGSACGTGPSPSWECGKGNYCTGTCTPKTQLGASCVVSEGGLSCPDLSLCTDGICALPPAGTCVD